MAVPGSRFGRPRAANGGVRLVIEWRCQARYLVRSKRGKGTGTLFGEGERSTCNVQLSTFNGVTERVHGGRDMGTDTIFGPTDAGGIITPDGSGCRLRFHLGNINEKDIKIANVS